MSLHLNESFVGNIYWIMCFLSILPICFFIKELNPFTFKVIPGESESHSVMSDSLWLHVLYSPWRSPGQNTGVGSLSLLQGIFPTQGSNPGLLHCRWILYQLSHKESPRILEWVACPFSSESSQPRNRTGVSCIAGRFFTNWAMREAQFLVRKDSLLSLYYLFTICPHSFFIPQFLCYCLLFCLLDFL